MVLQQAGAQRVAEGARETRKARRTKGARRARGAFFLENFGGVGKVSYLCILQSEGLIAVND